MRKLKKNVDNETQMNDETSKVFESIRKIQRNNFSEIEKFDTSEWTADFHDIAAIGMDMNKAERKMREKTKSASAPEIYAGFISDENLRFMYESLKVRRFVIKAVGRKEQSRNRYTSDYHARSL